MTIANAPLTPQQKRDTWAKSRGYRSYFGYRDEQAKAAGYRSYAEQRKARRTGIGLQGEDRPGGRRAIAPVPKREPTRFILPPKQPAPPLTVDLPTRYSQRVRLEYRQLEAEAQRASVAVITQKAKYTPGSSGARKLAGSFEEKVKTTSLHGLRYARDDLPDLFQAAAASVNPEFGMDDASKKILEGLQREAVNGIQQMDRFAKKDVGRYVTEANKIAAEKGERFAAKNGIKGIRFNNGARWTVGNYSEMLLVSNANRTFNSGVLAGLKTAGIEVVEVSDGAECGWSSHKDPDKANGKIVSVDFAMDHLSAHPHCQRRFTGRPDISLDDADQKLLSRGAKGTLLTAAVGAGVAVAGLYASSQQGRVATFLRNAYKQNPRFVAYEFHLRQFKTRLAQAKDLKPHQLYDFVSGLPVVETEAQLAHYFKAAKSSVDKMSSLDVKQLAEIVSMFEEQWIKGVEVPAYIRQILRLDADAPRRVVGEAFREFSEYEKFRFKYMDQNFMGSLASFVDIEQRARDTFWRWATPVGPRFAKYSYPKIGDERYGRMTVLDSEGLVKFTRTTTRRGPINRLTFNRNGLLRAGLTLDPETSRIKPDLRLVAKKLPIRIYTTPNISKRTGRVISASVEVVFITPTPVNFKIKFYASLRVLGVGQTAQGGVEWKDLLKVRAGDLRRMKRLDPDFFKIVSVGAETRIRGSRSGFGRVGPFNFPATFNIPWEEAVALWQLTTYYLQLQLEELKRKLLGGFGDVDWRMFGLPATGPELTPGEEAKGVLELLIQEIQRLLGQTGE